jgi:ABC-type sulfate transport system permease subunit
LVAVLTPDELHVEVLYNDFNFAASFGVASLLL